MRVPCLLPLTIIVFAWPQVAAAGDWIDHGELVTAITYGYATAEQSSLTRELELKPAIEISASDSVTGRVSLRIRGDDLDRWLPGEPDFSSYDDLSKPLNIDHHWTVELRDAYVNIALPRGQLRLGKQQIVWGALDGIKVLDAMNPQSFERFILEDFDASRIGLWSAYADLSLGAWRTELAVIADTTTHYLPEQGAWMAFTAPRYRFGATGTNEDIPMQRRDPDSGDINAGLRFSRYFGGVDLQFVAISGLDFEPLGALSFDQGEPVIETFHKRRELYGVSAESSFGAIALRGELAYSPERLFNTGAAPRLDTVALDNWRGAIGVDINAPWNVFINLQFLYDEVSQAPADLVRDRVERVFTALFKRRFAYDTVDMEFRFYQSMAYRDRLLRGALSYELSDTMTLKLAVENFQGDSRGPFGQFNQRDQVSLTWELTL